MTTVLGPANDDPPEVQVEIRAAELATPHGSMHSYYMSMDEAEGWHMHRIGASPVSYRDYHPDPLSGWGAHRHAGWLAHEIVTHDQRDERDRDAWSWDASRPVSGQAPSTKAESK